MMYIPLCILYNHFLTMPLHMFTAEELSSRFASPN